jgi:hypothetical protein
MAEVSCFRAIVDAAIAAHYTHYTMKQTGQTFSRATHASKQRNLFSWLSHVQNRFYKVMACN